MGPLFQRYVVSLTGTVDERWLASFHEVAKDSETLNVTGWSRTRA